MRKITCASRSSSSVSGCPFAPSEASATPNRMAKNTTCSTSPFANASTALDGTMWVKKSTKCISFPCAAYDDTSPLASELTSRPEPGFVTFTTTSPMASETVLTISKYSSALPPTRPTFFRSLMLAIPSTMVRKMTGAITILMRFTNTSPSGRIALAVSGATSPSTTASAMATRTWTVRFRWRGRGTSCG